MLCVRRQIKLDTLRETFYGHFFPEIREKQLVSLTRLKCLMDFDDVQFDLALAFDGIGNVLHALNQIVAHYHITNP